MNMIRSRGRAFLRRAASWLCSGRTSSVDSDGHLTGCDVERGMATAEYAVATLAAAGFAGLLLVLLRSGQVQELLQGIIQRALAVG